MTDPLENILQQTGMKSSAFSSTSRYYATETVTKETGDGETLVYLRRRFVPLSDRFSVLFEHMVSQGERLDNITHLYLGDPGQFWRICDANGALHPDELTDTIGQRIKITLSEGVSGY
jgi:hypothetical protein